MLKSLKLKLQSMGNLIYKINLHRKTTPMVHPPRFEKLRERGREGARVRLDEGTTRRGGDLTRVRLDEGATWRGSEGATWRGGEGTRRRAYGSEERRAPEEWK